MSEIYLDPMTMDATAGAIGEHAREVETAMADLASSCAAEVPPALGDWFAEELHDIALIARLAGLLYAVAALDTALRAQQIQADQSLATAWPGLTAPTGLATMGDLGAALAGSTVVGGTGPAFASGVHGPDISVVGGSGPAIAATRALSSVAVGGSSPLPDSITGGESVMTDGPLDLDQFAGLFESGSHASATSLLELVSFGANLNDTRLAPSGIVYTNGAYEDSAGRRGDASAIYHNPDRPGEFRVRS